MSPNEIEIGLMLTPSAWGQGYGTEAGSAVRDEAFDRLKLASIVAVHHPEKHRVRTDHGEAGHGVRAGRRGQAWLALPPLPPDAGAMGIDAMSLSTIVLTRTGSHLYDNWEQVWTSALTS